MTQLTNFSQMRRLDTKLKLTVRKLNIVKNIKYLEILRNNVVFQLSQKNFQLTFCKRLQKVSNFPNIYISENSNGFSEGSSSNFCLVFWKHNWYSWFSVMQVFSFWIKGFRGWSQILFIWLSVTYSLQAVTIWFVTWRLSK